MLGIQTAAGTRRAALTRFLLTLVCGPAIIFACMIAPIVKFVLIVVVPMYLLWVFAVDAVTLGRGLFRDVRYAERPHFAWFFGIPLAFFIVWAFLAFTPVGGRIVGHLKSTPYFDK